MFTEDQRIDFAGLYIETRYEMRDKSYTTGVIGRWTTFNSMMFESIQYMYKAERVLNMLNRNIKIGNVAWLYSPDSHPPKESKI